MVYQTFNQSLTSSLEAVTSILFSNRSTGVVAATKGSTAREGYVCDYESKYKSALYRHIWMKHPNTRLFKCTVCGQAFFTQTQLR